MENNGVDTSLDGGPPNPEVGQETVGSLAALAKQLEREAAGPTSTPTPQKIEREDLLEYKLLGSRAAHAELQVTMYHRELQRSQAEANLVAHDASNFMTMLEKKYNFDCRISMITEDGVVVPRPVDQRAALMRK